MLPIRDQAIRGMPYPTFARHTITHTTLCTLSRHVMSLYTCTNATLLRDLKDKLGNLFDTSTQASNFKSVAPCVKTIRNI